MSRRGAMAKPRWERRKDARPAELLEAALQEFVEKGYAATRLEDVAARAGVSKGTLYLYFANKQELFEAVVRSALIPNLVQGEALLASYQGGSRELLTQLLSGLWRVVAHSNLSGIPKLVISEAGNFPEIAEFYYREVISRGRSLMEQVIARGVRRGEFRRVNPAYAWRMVLAPLLLGILWKHSFLSLEGEGFDFDRYLQSYLDLLFNGLARETAP